MAEPLLPSDRKQGYIYIFWDEVNFGKLKIGRTNNLERRLHAWNRKCRRKHSYHSNDVSLVEIAPVRRIEDLIHIELQECRKRRMCKSCSETHKEWFDVDQKHAVRVLKKWQEWGLRRPYALDPSSGKWMIRPEMEDIISSFCEPVIREEKQQGRRKKINGVWRRSQTKPGRSTM
jgi:predicted GIY-YIG superfamily endonuclease